MTYKGYSLDTSHKPDPELVRAWKYSVDLFLLFLHRQCEVHDCPFESAEAAYLMRLIEEKVKGG